MALTDEIARREGLASAGALTEDGKKQLDQDQKDRKIQVQRVKQLDQGLAALSKRVSVSEEIIWPQTPQDRELNASPNPRNRSALEALFTLGERGYSPDQLSSTFAVKGRLVRVLKPVPLSKCTEDTTLCSKNQVKASRGEGLLFREPVAARLVICEVAEVRNCQLNGASGVVVSSAVMAPQLGQLRLLPFRNGVFQHNELKAVFRENGSLASFSYDEKAARGKELAEALSDGLDQAVSYRDARQAAKDKQAADALSLIHI